MSVPRPRSRDSNDQHYKTLFRTMLRELLQITHPKIAPTLLFEKARFLDKETYVDLLGGKGYRLDLVCEIPTVDGGCRLLLVHVEIEERTPRAKKGVPFVQRMANYVMTLWLRHQIPVLPIVVTFAPRSGGMVVQEFRLEALGEQVLSLRFRRMGVAGLSAASFLRRKNPLGHALAMRMRRGGMSKVELQLACERRIVHDQVDDGKRILLLNSVKTYARLNPAEQREYERLLQEQQNQAVKEVNVTWMEQMERRMERRLERRYVRQGKEEGKKEGIKEGKKEGLQEAIGMLWEERFGPLPAGVNARLETVTDPAQLGRILKLVHGARDRQDAKAQLDALCPAP